MTTMQRLVRSLIVCAIAAAITATAAAEGVVKVISVEGHARYTTGNNVWLPLKGGAILKTGTIIETMDKSKAFMALGENDGQVPHQVSYTTPVVGAGAIGAGAGVSAYKPMADQNIIVLHPNSKLSVDKLLLNETGAGTAMDTQLDLQKGQLFGNVKKMPAGSNYEIKFVNGVAGVRGTIYQITASGAVQVLVGSVVVAYTDASGNVVTQVVLGGQQFDPGTGLIQPIPDFVQKEMVRESKEARIGPNTPPTTFSKDNTIYYVSPTQGHNGNASPNGIASLFPPNTVRP